MAWSEWKKFGSYSKYHYSPANQNSTNKVTVPNDCTSGILLVICYNNVSGFSISDGTGIVSKNALFENIGTGGVGNVKMYAYNCTFNKNGVFTMSRSSNTYAFDALILY